MPLASLSAWSALGPHRIGNRWSSVGTSGHHGVEQNRRSPAVDARDLGQWSRVNAGSNPACFQLTVQRAAMGQRVRLPRPPRLSSTHSPIPPTRPALGAGASALGRPAPARRLAVRSFITPSTPTAPVPAAHLASATYRRYHPGRTATSTPPRHSRPARDPACHPRAIDRTQPRATMHRHANSRPATARIKGRQPRTLVRPEVLPKLAVRVRFPSPAATAMVRQEQWPVLESRRVFAKLGGNSLLDLPDRRSRQRHPQSDDGRSYPCSRSHLVRYLVRH